MIDFFLHKYTQSERTLNPFVAPQKFKQKQTPDNMKQLVWESWNRQKQVVINSFVKKLKEHYTKEDRFLLFTPASTDKTFVIDIINVINEEFKGSIDLTSCFNKTAVIRFGDFPYKELSIEELMKYIEVKIDKPTIDNNINSVFIVDDIYSSGKTIELTSQLIKQYFGDQMEIKSGVILKI